MTAAPSSFATLPQNLVLVAVRSALDEDLGLSGDITTDATVSPNARSVALLAARKPGIVSGLALAEAAFRELDPACDFTVQIADGCAAFAGDTIARISGKSRAILSAERVALNFMGRMCGIATLTRRYADAVAGTGAQIVDTRKTTPGLRAFEKYAVRCGGGHNHRFGLFDAILIKDNHIVAAGGIEAAIRAAKATAGHMTKIEVEVDTLEQLEIVVREGADCVLLDNMGPADLRKAVGIVAGRCLTEASGGVNLDTVREIAATGVNMISVGALTHSAPVLDLGLDFVLSANTSGAGA
ncbi:carboxylating nicotinate-nucleotide diphosphorylase [Hyphomicrobium sp. 2TAF46]|uniref:carboxylating nicotinate-nucleotide diphosphorylase n=1 Tax=Hyphomicrobium sp. 2TAF46 TaxID=3233019 RepID=UPI003F8FBD75